MRSTYLVCYDIADDKRLRRVFQIMRSWGDWLQYSVFECQLTPTDCRAHVSAAPLKPIIAAAVRRKLGLSALT